MAKKTRATPSTRSKRSKVTAEESVSKGIRRITALTGKPASEAWARAKVLEETVASAMESEAPELPSAIAAINAQLSAVLPLRAKRRAQAAVAELQARQKAAGKSAKSSGDVDAVATAQGLLAEAAALGPGKLIVGEIAGASDDQLRSAIDSLRAKAPSSAILLASAVDGKVTFNAAVSDDLIALGLKAGDWVREAAKVAGGGGGGRPQMAQAGGKDPSKLPAALEAARQFATAKIR